MTQKITDYDFDLPQELIALRPVSPRSSARMLVQGDLLEDKHVYDLPTLLQPGDLLIFNDTKVIPARLFGHRVRNGVSAQVELTLLSPVSETTWHIMAKPLRRLQDGDTIEFSSGDIAIINRFEDDNQITCTFSRADVPYRAGVMPLPPYIATRRPADAQDEVDYQTVFAKNSGAIAAPTAALHFDDALLEALQTARIDHTTLTLHVGAGTFLPVKVEDIKNHKMHAEWGEISETAVQKIRTTHEKGGRIIAVGTTALRLLETAAQKTGRIEPWVGETDIFITPGFKFKVADKLLTNFHLPKSTLMMLVSAFAGFEEIKKLYRHAVENEYRFYSYGDCCLLTLKTDSSDS